MAKIISIKVDQTNTAKKRFSTDNGVFIVEPFFGNQYQIFKESGEHIANVYNAIQYIEQHL